MFDEKASWLCSEQGIFEHHNCDGFVIERMLTVNRGGLLTSPAGWPRATEGFTLDDFVE